MKKTIACIVAFLLFICVLGLAACGQVLDAGSSGESASALRVSYIDVGKGDCILVQADDSSVLIDTGYKKTADDVLAYLSSQGVDHLDAIILTHYDRDHVEGVRKIGEGVDVGAIYLPGYVGSDNNYQSCVSSVAALGVPVSEVMEELTLNVGNAHLTVYPSKVAYVPATDDEEGNDNDVSLVAALVNGSDSYLFAGDLEEEGIAAYLAAKHGQYDVLKMPHHGRRASNTSDFIGDVKPQIAVITDSKKESADKKVIKLLESADVETYRTSTDGTVVVESDGSGTYAVR